MHKLLLFSLLSLALLTHSTAQNPNTHLLHHDRVTARSGPTTLNPAWSPFYHGVASGDPLSDRVVIWTRVTPEEINSSPIEVAWRVATDPDLADVVQSGTFTTDFFRDYTVKIDVTGLTAGTTYYYGFTVGEKNSLTGKTKTTPTDMQAEHLKFAVVSCSNFQAGYFNAYHRIADRTDLDAVIHLGDYIYEYADGVYGDSALFETRPLEPTAEALDLVGYRMRYSTYRLDTNLIRVHQQHPFITVWDDHETANDAYTDGAQNHDEETEGDWATRKAVGKQVYFEWMPIRENPQQEVYRTIRYGNLVDLIMLDTRLHGREEQLASINDPALQAADRTILGADQKAWLKTQLQQSTAQWKLIGQQVLFSELNVGWGALAVPVFTFESMESLFLDIWDGYPAERTEIIDFVSDNGIDNVVILTGDFHTTLAFDVVDQPVDLAFQTLPIVGEAPVYSANENYTEATGAGSVMVEFATPSVTSANFDERFSLQEAQTLQNQIHETIQPIPAINLGNPNPHMKFADLSQHGYYIVDVQTDRAQANWYFSEILQPSEAENFGEAWYTQDGNNHLQASNTASPPKAMQDEPAPNDPPLLNDIHPEEEAASFAILAVYPNPFQHINTLHYSLSVAERVQINLIDVSGKVIQRILDTRLQAGVYSLQLDGQDLPTGTYFYQIQVGNATTTIKLVRN